MTYEHLEIRPLATAERRKTPVPIKPPQRNYAAHARQLSAAAGDIASKFRSKRERGGHQAPAAAYFSVRTSRPLPDKELISVRIHPVMRQGRNYFVAFADEDDLQTFVNQVQQYALGPTEGHKDAYKAGVFSAIEELLPRHPRERLPASLRNEVIHEATVYELDFEILPQPYNVRLSDRLNQLQRVISQNRGEVEDISDEGTYALVRATVTGQCLLDLLEYWDDVNIRDLPMLAPSVREVVHFEQSEVPDITPPNPDCPTAVIVDTGISESHPLLAPAVRPGLSKSFHAGTTDPYDSDGHGTEVAGRGLYGSVEACLAARTFRPEFWIAGAKVLHNGGADKEFFSNKMVRILDYFGSSVRIYNLSLGDMRCIFDGSNISYWAEALDKLSVSRDVVFVVSAGNIMGGDLQTLLRTHGGYPHHWKSPVSRLYSPAEAAHALTVGAIAGTSELYRPAANRQVLADRFYPSPFTRRGPGISDSIKPDLVEIGGNAYIDTNTNLVGAHDPNMRVVTLDWDYINSGKLLVFGGPGTSVAAPTVMNVAAKVLAKFPMRSSNLIRALVVNSARVPASSLPKDMIPQLYGYGVPVAERALYSTAKRVTLIHEGAIKPDTCQVFEIPLPEALLSTGSRKEITVTLAYNAPVDRTKSSYFGVDLEWKLSKGTVSVDQVLAKVAEEMEADDDGTDEDTKIWWAGEYPGFRKRSKGSVQKDVFRWTRADRGTQLYLVVTARKRWILDPEYHQPYAIVVTIEDLSESANDIFTPIRSAVRGRVPARV